MEMTRSVRNLGLVVALLLATTAPGFAQTAPPDPTRLAAARDLLDVTGVSRQMDGMITAMSQGFERGAAHGNNPAAGKAASKEFNVFLEKFSSYRQTMLDDFAALYAERFTADELKAIADFYRSGPGSRFIAAMPELMQAGSRIGMTYAEKVIAEIKKDGGKP
jgi:hypothetical protein